MQVIEFIKFVQNKKILIRRISALVFFILLGIELETSGAVYEAYSPGDITDVPAMVKEIKTTRILTPFLFTSFWIMYATFTKHIWVHIAIYFVFLLTVNSGEVGSPATLYLLTFIFYELFHRFIYLNIIDAILETKDKVMKVTLLFFKYLFKTIGISISIFVLYSFVTGLLYDFSLNCGKLPFKEFFSSYGYKSCDETVKITLVRGEHIKKSFWSSELAIDEESKRIKFKIPRSYVTDNYWKEEEVDELILLLAYPTYEPWFKAKARYVNDEGDAPIEVTVKLNKFKNTQAKRKQDIAFIRERYGLKKVYDSSYYYPIDEGNLVEYIMCGDFAFSPNASCRATTNFSDYLRGEYRFKLRDLPNWKEIDLEVRKLVASLMDPKQQEKIYLID